MNPSFRNPVIFVVDDEIGWHTIVSRMLVTITQQLRCLTRGTDAIAALQNDDPCDLLITDARLLEMDGLELLAQVKKVMPLLPVIMVTACGEFRQAVQALRQGAADYLEKNGPEDAFRAAVREALDQSPYARLADAEPLTRSEIRVLQMVADGKTNAQIAYVLDRSIRTVECHRYRLMQKLKVDSMADLIKNAIALGLTGRIPPQRNPVSFEATLAAKVQIGRMTTTEYP